MRRKVAKLISLIGFLAIVLAFQNCAQLFPSENQKGQASNDQVVDLSVFEKDAIEVLKRECADCHSPGSGNPGPEDILNFSQLEQEGYIVMGRPQNSPLYIEVIDNIMPQDAPLSDTDKEALRLWLLGENVFTDEFGAPPPSVDPSAPPATFGEVMVVLETHCASCHQNGNASGGVALNNFNEVRDYVVPGNPNASVLYDSLATMPPGDPLGKGSTQGGIFYTWINDGAPNN